jgi:probable sporulation protein (polysaccharide deacetylase family)
LSLRTQPFRKGRILGLVIILAALIAAEFHLNKQLPEPVKAAMAPVYQGNELEKKTALTFNVVWGEEYIPQILDILKTNEVTATFFIGGQWAEDFPVLTGRIAQAGHEIGNHGYSHPHPDKLSMSANIDEIKKTDDILFRLTGIKPSLFAPPYGERGDAVLKAANEAGYRTILWSIDTIDWQRPDPAIITRRVTEKIHNGAIILMHPTAPTVNALPQIILELKNMGYEMVSVATLLQGLQRDNGNHS